VAHSSLHLCLCVHLGNCGPLPSRAHSYRVISNSRPFNRLQLIPACQLSSNHLPTPAFCIPLCFSSLNVVVSESHHCPKTRRQRIHDFDLLSAPQVYHTARSQFLWDHGLVSFFSYFELTSVEVMFTVTLHCLLQFPLLLCTHGPFNVTKDM
jgi:hypothetical protein